MFWDIVTIMLFVVLAAALAAAPSELPERGVSEELARERVATVRDLHYSLWFTIPSERRDPVKGRAQIRFSLQAPQRVVLDFARPKEHVVSIRVGGREAAAEFINGHIVVPASATRAGANEVEIEFVSGDEALNRNDEFLYTLFVPARAQLAFPCFDQPDLKGRYRLTLTVPAGWQAVANGAETKRGGQGSGIGDQGSGSGDQGSGIRGTETIEFAVTEPLPTYVFSFVAGRFSVETATRAGRVLRLFHRETDAAKVARNRDAIFDLHAASLAWLESYTAIPYSFGKFDVVAIPSFQFGGMEHAGAILYNASSLMLDESATQNQLLGRASVIAHETAHMWFGDLVTMRWFNDVWMKEVFANFMAAKIVNPSFPQVNHELRFLLDNYPSAYQVDRTAGTNAIRQPLGNLADAGQLYGPVIYQKAPVVMRQLELMVGESVLRDGLREYLKTYRFGNATWLDLVRILDDRTPHNLKAWSRAWVEERGRPEFTTSLHIDSRGRISRIRMTMDDPLKRGLTWPQRLRVAVGYPGQVRHVPVDVTSRVTSAGGTAGLQRPLYVLPNGGGLGYGLFVLDQTSRTYFLEQIEEIPDPLTRGSAWVTLWDNLLEGQVTATDFVDTAMRAVPRESDEQNVQRVLGYIVRAFWKHLPSEARLARGPALETMLRAGVARANTQSEKAAWFNAYRDTVLSKDGLEWLERVWKREEKIPGLVFSEPDEIAMALELAVRDVPNAGGILKAQLDRTQNPDRKARFAFVMPALSGDPAERERAFERFRNVQNRRREPWVLESIAYLNHPLREAHARRFVGPALELLREIHQTGDIFFPTRWMESTLSGHRSIEVATTVREFLARELLYPQRLRWTILSTSDELFRVARQ